MNCPTENKPFSWPSFFILMCSMFAVVHSRSYYPPKYEEPPPPPTTNRIKLNLGLHVPPIVIKMPRMEMPQLVIGANIIKNPKAKPLTINMPPPPSISFGDPPAPAPKYEMPYGYRAASSSQLNPVKVPNEMGLDLKAFGSENHDRSMQVPPSAAAVLPPPAPVPMVPGQYPAQYMPPQYQQYPQQAVAAAAAPQPSMYPPPMMPMAPPQMYAPPVAPNPSSMMAMPSQMFPTMQQSYPMQQPYYYPQYPMAESQQAPPTMEPQPTQFNPEAYQLRQGMPKRPEWSNMIQAQESLMPPPMYQTPPAPKSPFQLVKNPGQGQRFGLKPTLEHSMFDDSVMSEAADMETDDLAKQYNAAPKILMHRFQKV